MSLDTMQPKQHVSAHQGLPQQVPAILICKNSLVCAGIRHILDGTRFIVAGEFDDSSMLSGSPEASDVLYIIAECHSADALVNIVAELKAQCPMARVVVLADHLDPTSMMRALQAGIHGLCSPKTDSAVLIRALELVMLGETFISSAMALAMLDEPSQVLGSATAATPDLVAADDAATRPHNLSGREAEILRRLMEGESNKVIARKLDVAEATIKVHIKAILRKVRAKNRTQAAIWATTHLNRSPGSGHVPPAVTSKV
jgi:two-component system nitrate/nitrite response regulator NarL